MDDTARSGPRTARLDTPSGSHSDSAILTRALSKHYRNPWTLKITRGVDGLIQRHNNQAISSHEMTFWIA